MPTFAPIPGFDGYRATCDGRVYGRRSPTKPLSVSPDRDGYLQVMVRAMGKSYSRRVHTLVALAFLPPAPAHWTVDHINGCKTDNRVENLRWIAREQNSREAMTRAGRRLMPEQVRSIRQRAANGERYMSIARDFGRSETTIWKIAQRQRYCDLPSTIAPRRYRRGSAAGVTP